jgi:hypothetical protein
LGTGSFSQDAAKRKKKYREIVTRGISNGRKMLPLRSRVLIFSRDKMLTARGMPIEFKKVEI